MIYGKLSLEDWRNISVEGEVPESSFENHNLRLFFTVHYIIVMYFRQTSMTLMRNWLLVFICKMGNLVFLTWTVLLLLSFILKNNVA